MQETDNLGVNQVDVDSSLTQKEIREIVTPYAFGVADDLIGTPLASPMRRGIALLTDLILVTSLTSLNSLVLAGLSAWAFWRAGNKLKQSRRFGFARKLLRFVVALILFVVALGIFDMLHEQVSGEDPDNQMQSDGEKVFNANGVELATLSVKYILSIKKQGEQIELGECAPAKACWQPTLSDMTADLARLSIPAQKAYKLMDETTRQLPGDLSKQSRAELLSDMREQYQQLRPDELKKQDETFAIAAAARDAEDEKSSDDEDEPSTNPGIIAWLEALAADLGIGFGWSAFYFTVFTAWWKGQTPGKKLLSIKVIRLDGNSLNLWESFGRYGGYGAGLATGLLGFLQIYWDPNRQAIQDKISETLVIQTNLPKHKGFEQKAP
ncbi:RDD family protein [Neptunicella sp. SCSIO 80796]|uniref:RDD family protein n=1 Tax=Neptunicella plasticusilytica TaxID=3117012 RepID=UPI003A4D569F